MLLALVNLPRLLLPPFCCCCITLRMLRRLQRDRVEWGVLFRYEWGGVLSKSMFLIDCQSAFVFHMRSISRRSAKEGFLNRVEQTHLKGRMSFVHKATDLLLGLVMLKAARFSIPLLSYLCLSEDCVICACALANTGTLPFFIVTRSHS